MPGGITTAVDNSFSVEKKNLPMDWMSSVQQLNAQALKKGSKCQRQQRRFAQVAHLDSYVRCRTETGRSVSFISRSAIRCGFDGVAELGF